MHRYVDFETIKSCQTDLPFQWTEEWLTKQSYWSGSKLKFTSVCGRGSKKLWRVDDVVAAAQRRYGRASPDAVVEFAMRLNLPVATPSPTKRNRARI